MKFVKSAQLDSAQKEAILNLWNNEYPKVIAHTSVKSLEEYFDKSSNHQHVLLYSDDQKLIGWFFGFQRDEERWFAIIVNSEFQRKGFGSTLLQKAKSLFKELNGWVVTNVDLKRKNGELYKSPLSFYKNNEFQVLENEVFQTEVMTTVKIRWTKKR